MINPTPGEAVVPVIYEKSAWGVIAAGQGVTSIVLPGIASIHARQAVVELSATVNLSSIDLRIYGFGRQLVAVVNLFVGIHPANTVILLQYPAGLAQEFDVQVTNDTVGAGQATVWAAARV